MQGEPADARWDRARVLGLAPDDGARRAAGTLAAVRWQDAGHDPGGLVWGRDRGSGSSPYEVVADPTAPAFACSCPSRKVPCKHALGLLLHWSAGRVPLAEPAEFAQRWQRQRGAASPGTEPTGPARAPGELADPAAAAARAAVRAERVAAGLDELATWLGDQLRSGLAGLERAGYAHVDAVAARMVDAQAPGVAGILRGIPGELAREGWPERVLDTFAALHLLIRAHRGLAALPPDLAATVRSRIGYPVAKADVLAGVGVDDDWLAVGQVDTVEYRLETRRVWLWGRRSHRWALWLTFAPPGGTPDGTVTAGMRLRARLHVYPGSGQYRAVIGEQHDLPADTEVGLPPAESMTEARERFAVLLGQDPWATRMPAVLHATPVPPAGPGLPWRLRDRDGWCRDVVGLGADPWPLVAQARGHELPVVVEWSGAGVRPLAVLDATTAATVRRAA